MLLAINGYGESAMRHKDYVPNERTAIVIAEAVLVAQYGEDSVNKQKPLKAELKENKMWLVQGTIKKPEMIGGNYGVWIDKASGCLKIMENMK